MPARPGPRISDLLAYLIGVVVLAGSLTILWRSMRAVMDIGGMCASGGPYVVAVECPDAVGWLLPLAIFAGLGGAALIGWFGGRIGPGFAMVAALAWPALFLSLGWNFLEYGLASPGGWEIGWLICGVLFIAMGGVPLVIGLRALRRGPVGPRARGMGPTARAPRPGSRTVTIDLRPTVTTPPTSPVSAAHVELAQLLRQVQGATVAQAAEVTVADATDGAWGDTEAAGRLGGDADPTAEGLVDQLERLARLKAEGALGELEYLQAKQAVIDAARKSTGTEP